jgi:hypothetical protein
VLLEPDNLSYLPLFMLDVKTDGGVLDYSDTPSLFVTVVAQLLDDAISAIGDVREIDLFDKSVSVPLTLHPLSTVSAGEDEVRDLRDGLVAQAEDSIVALAEFLDSMRAHEELLQRDEAAYVRAFEESKKDPPSLAELKDKVAAERAHKAQLEAQLPNRVLIGTYLVNTETRPSPWRLLPREYPRFLEHHSKQRWSSSAQDRPPQHLARCSRTALLRMHLAAVLWRAAVAAAAPAPALARTRRRAAARARRRAAAATAGRTRRRARHAARRSSPKHRFRASSPTPSTVRVLSEFCPSVTA